MAASKELALRLTVNDDGATKSLNSLESSLAGITKAIAAVTAGLSAVVGAKFFAESFREARGLEEEMKVIQSLAGMNAQEFDKFSQSTRQVAKDLGSLTAVDLAQIEHVAVTMGVAKDQIVDFSKDVGLGAIALDAFGRDTAKLSTHLAKQMAVFGDGADKVNNYMSSMFSLENSTAASALEISSFNQQLGASAKQLNLSQAEASAWGAVLVSAGMDASDAATRVASAQNIFIQHLNVDKNNSLVAAMEAIDSAADGGAKSLAMLEEVLGGTIESFGGLENAIMTGLNVNAGATFKAINASLGQMENSVQQNQLAVKMYGAVGAKALVTLALNADELDKQVSLSNEAFEKGVAIQEAYATIASSNSEKLKVFWSVINDIQLQIGGPLLNAMAKLTEMSFTPLANQLSEWMGSSQAVQTFFNITLPNAANAAATAINGFAVGMTVAFKGIIIVMNTLGTAIDMIRENLGVTYPFFDVITQNLRTFSAIILGLPNNPFEAWMRSAQPLQVLFETALPTAINAVITLFGKVLDAIMPITSLDVFGLQFIRSLQESLKWMDALLAKLGIITSALSALASKVGMFAVQAGFEGVVTVVDQISAGLAEAGQEMTNLRQALLPIYTTLGNLGKTFASLQANVMAFALAGNAVSEKWALLKIYNDVLKVKSIFTQLISEILPIKSALSLIESAVNTVIAAIQRLGDIAYGHSVLPELYAWFGKLMQPVQTLGSLFVKLGSTLQSSFKMPSIQVEGFIKSLLSSTDIYEKFIAKKLSDQNVEYLTIFNKTTQTRLLQHTSNSVDSVSTPLYKFMGVVELLKNNYSDTIEFIHNHPINMTVSAVDIESAINTAQELKETTGDILKSFSAISSTGTLFKLSAENNQWPSINEVQQAISEHGDIAAQETLKWMEINKNSQTLYTEAYAYFQDAMWKVAAENTSLNYEVIPNYINATSEGLKLNTKLSIEWNEQNKQMLATYMEMWGYSQEFNSIVQTAGEQATVYTEQTSEGLSTINSTLLLVGGTILGVGGGLLLWKAYIESTKGVFEKFADKLADLSLVKSLGIGDNLQAIGHQLDQWTKPIQDFLQHLSQIATTSKIVESAIKAITIAIEWLGDVAYGHSVFPSMHMWMLMLLQPIAQLIGTFRVWVDVLRGNATVGEALFTTLSTAIITALVPLELLIRTIVVAFFTIRQLFSDLSFANALSIIGDAINAVITAFSELSKFIRGENFVASLAIDLDALFSSAAQIEDVFVGIQRLNPFATQIIIIRQFAQEFDPIRLALALVIATIVKVTEAIQWLGDVAYGHSVLPEIYSWLVKLQSPFTVLSKTVISFGTLLADAFKPKLSFSEYLQQSEGDTYSSIISAKNVGVVRPYAREEIDARKEIEAAYLRSLNTSKQILAVTIATTTAIGVIGSGIYLWQRYLENAKGIFEKFADKLANTKLISNLGIGDELQAIGRQLDEWTRPVQEFVRELEPVKKATALLEKALYGVSEAIDYIAEIGWRHSVFPEFVHQIEILVRHIAWFDRNVKHAVGTVGSITMVIFEWAKLGTHFIAARDAARGFADIIRELTGIDLNKFFKPFGELFENFSFQSLSEAIHQVSLSLQEMLHNLTESAKGPLQVFAKIAEDYLSFNIQTADLILSGLVEMVGRVFSGDFSGAIYTGLRVIGTYVEYEIEKWAYPLQALIPQINDAMTRIGQSVNRMIIGLGDEFFQFFAMFKPTYDDLVGNTFLFVGDLVLGLEQFESHIAEILNYVARLVTAIFGYDLKRAVTEATQGIAEIFDALVDLIAAVIQRGSPKIAGSFSNLANQISTIWRQVTTVIIETFNPKLFEALVAGLLQLASNVIGIFTRTKNTLFDTDVAFLNLLSGGNSLAEKIAWWLTRTVNLYVRLIELAVHFVNALFAVKQAMNWIADRVRPIVEGFLLASTIAFGMAVVLDKNASATERFRNAIVSVATIFQTTALSAISQFFTGFDQIVPKAADILSSLLDSSVMLVKNGLMQLQIALQGTFLAMPVNALVDWLLPQIDAAHLALSQWIDSIESSLLSISAKVRPVVENMAIAIANAIRFAVSLSETESAFERVKIGANAVVAVLQDGINQLRVLADNTIFEGPMNSILSLAQTQISFIHDMLNVLSTGIQQAINGDWAGAVASVFDGIALMIARRIQTIADTFKMFLSLLGLEAIFPAIDLLSANLIALSQTVVNILKTIFASLVQNIDISFEDTASIAINDVAIAIGILNAALENLNPTLKILQAGEWLTETFSKAHEGIEELLDLISNDNLSFGEFWQALVGSDVDISWAKWDDFKALPKDLYDEFVGTFSTMWNTLEAEFVIWKHDWTAGWDEIVDFLPGLKEIFLNEFHVLWAGLQTKFTLWKHEFVKGWDGLCEEFIGTFTTLWNTLQAKFTLWKHDLIKIFEDIKTEVVAIFTGIVEAIEAKITAVKNMIPGLKEAQVNTTNLNVADRAANLNLDIDTAQLEASMSKVDALLQQRFSDANTSWRNYFSEVDTSGIENAQEALAKLKLDLQEAMAAGDIPTIKALIAEFYEMEKAIIAADYHIKDGSLIPDLILLSIQAVKTISQNMNLSDTFRQMGEQIQQGDQQTADMSLTLADVGNAVTQANTAFSPYLGYLQAGGQSAVQFANNVQTIATQNGIVNDSLTQTTQQVAQYGTQLSNVASTTQQAMDATVQAVQGNTQAAEQLLNQFSGGKFELAKTAFTQIQDSAVQLQDSFSKITLDQLDAEIGNTFPKLKDAIVNLQTNASEGMKAVLEGNVEKLQELYAQDPTALIQSVIEVQRAMGAFQEATNGNIGALKEMAAQDTEVGRLLTALLGLQNGVLDLTAIYKGKLTAAQRESLTAGQEAIESLKTGNQEIIDSAKQYNASIKSQSKMLQSLGLSTKELTVDYKSVTTEVRNAERAIIAGMENGANFTSLLAEQINRVKNAYAGLQMGMQISNDKIVQQLDNKIATLQQQGNDMVSRTTYQNKEYEGTMQYGYDFTIETEDATKAMMAWVADADKAVEGNMKKSQQYVDMVSQKITDLRTQSKALESTDIGKAAALEGMAKRLEDELDKGKKSITDYTDTVKKEAESAAKDAADKAKEIFEKQVSEQKQMLSSLGDTAQQWLLAQPDMGAILATQGIDVTDKATAAALEQIRVEQEAKTALEAKKTALEALMAAQAPYAAGIDKLSEDEKAWLAGQTQNAAVMDILGGSIDANTQKTLNAALEKQKAAQSAQAMVTALQQEKAAAEVQSTAIGKLTEDQLVWFASTDAGKAALDGMKGNLNATAQAALDNALAVQTNNLAVQDQIAAYTNTYEAQNTGLLAYQKLDEATKLWMATTDAGRQVLASMGLEGNKIIESELKQIATKDELARATQTQIDAATKAYQEQNKGVLTFNQLDAATKTWLATTDAGRAALDRLGISGDAAVQAELAQIKSRTEHEKVIKAETTAIEDLRAKAEMQITALGKLDNATLAWMQSLDPSALKEMNITLDANTQEILKNAAAAYEQEKAQTKQVELWKLAYREAHLQEEVYAKLSEETKKLILSYDSAAEATEALGVPIDEVAFAQAKLEEQLARTTAQVEAQVNPLGALAEVSSTVGERLGGLGGNIGKLGNIFGFDTSKITGVFDEIKSFSEIPQVMNEVKQSFAELPAMFSGLKDTFAGMFEGLKGFDLKNIFSADGLSQIASVAGMIMTAWGPLKDFFGKLFADTKSKGTEAAEAFQKFVASNVEGGDAMAAAMKQSFDDMSAAGFDFQKFLQQTGTTMDQTFGGISQNWQTGATAMDLFTQSIVASGVSIEKAPQVALQAVAAWQDMGLSAEEAGQKMLEIAKAAGMNEEQLAQLEAALAQTAATAPTTGTAFESIAFSAEASRQAIDYLTTTLTGLQANGALTEMQLQTLRGSLETIMLDGQMTGVEMQNFAQSLLNAGVPIDQVSQQILKIAEASGMSKDQIEQLKLSLTGMSENATASTAGLNNIVLSADASTQAISLLNDSLTAMQSSEQITAEQCGSLSQALTQLTSDGQITGDEMQTFIAQVAATGAPIDSMAQQLIALAQASGLSDAEIQLLTQALNANGLQATQNSQTLQTLQQAETSLSNNTLGLISNEELLTTAIGALGTKSGLTQDQINSMSQMLAKAGSDGQLTASELTALQDSMSKMGLATDQSNLILDRFAKTLDALPANKEINIAVKTQGTIPELAHGGLIKQGLAVVGDKFGPEIAQFPSGRWAFVGLHGAELHAFPAGTEIVPNHEIGEFLRHIPHFAKGGTVSSKLIDDTKKSVSQNFWQETTQALKQETAQAVRDISASLKEVTDTSSKINRDATKAYREQERALTKTIQTQKEQQFLDTVHLRHQVALAKLQNDAQGAALRTVQTELSLQKELAQEELEPLRQQIALQETLYDAQLQPLQQQIELQKLANQQASIGLTQQEKELELQKQLASQTLDPLRRQVEEARLAYEQSQIPVLLAQQQAELTQQLAAYQKLSSNNKQSSQPTTAPKYAATSADTTISVTITGNTISKDFNLKALAEATAKEINKKLQRNGVRV